MEDIVIVIPIYKEKLSDDEVISINSCINTFLNRDILFVCPEGLKISTIEKQLSLQINCKTFNKSYFKNTKSYNRLLMSKEFYLKFIKYQYILICQTDVLVLKDDLDYWIKEHYDNVGAPIFEGYTNPSNKMKTIGANGGFCLRNIQSCIHILSKIRIQFNGFKTLWNFEKTLKMKLFRVIRDGMIYNYKIKWLYPILNEDIFWSVIVPQRFPFFKTCHPNKALFFAFDANPRHLYNLSGNMLPMAIHAWKRYDLEFVNEVVFKN